MLIARLKISGFPYETSSLKITAKIVIIEVITPASIATLIEFHSGVFGGGLYRDTKAL